MAAKTPKTNEAMPLVQNLEISAVHVPDDRLRQVKPDFVALYAQQLKSGRVLPAVHVRQTPNGKAPYTLVSGAHRLAAHKEAGLAEIAVVVVAANAEQSRELEIEENLFRNELSALERIQTVSAYREIFEAKYGAIKAGNPNLNDNSANIALLDDLDLLGNVENSQQGGFFARVSKLMGLSARTAKLFWSIAKNLQPKLAEAIRNTPLEYNQAVIERLCKYEPTLQLQYAVILERTGGDILQADKALQPKTVLTAEQRKYEDIVDGWTRAGSKIRAKFVADYLPEIGKALVSDEASLSQFISNNRAAVESALRSIPDPELSGETGEKE
jgi:ParB family transcriptional regulator, chromosome partitioning protein